MDDTPRNFSKFPEQLFYRTRLDCAVVYSSMIECDVKSNKFYLLIHLLHFLDLFIFQPLLLETYILILTI